MQVTIQTCYVCGGEITDSTPSVVERVTDGLEPLIDIRHRECIPQAQWLPHPSANLFDRCHYDNPYWPFEMKG